MDVPRQNARFRRRAKKIAGGTVIAVAVLAGGLLFASLERLPPKVTRAEVRIAVVERGDMLRDVRAYGSLAAKNLLYVPAPCDGRVVAVNLSPGAIVSKDDVILVLSNPELELDVQSAESRLREAETAKATTQAQYESEYMQQKAAVAAARSDCVDRQLLADRDDELFEERLIPELARKRSRMQADTAKERLSTQEELLRTLRDETRAQLASCDARIAQEAASLAFARERVARLTVCAGTEGVLREVLVKPGQQVNSGVSVAVVVDPSELKAELRVPETQARDVLPGQAATVTVGSIKVPGKVTRIDPTATEGTVMVDVEFDASLAEGLRPDLTATGSIEIERLLDVLSIERPTQCSPHSSIGLFRVDAGGATASRVPVRLGGVAVTTVEVQEGLAEGDQVIVTDVSQWDGEDKLRLE